jgi:REP element-mobilizing transposase RayT
LARPAIAELVENALLHFDSIRYLLHAWVIMPTHVHALITPQNGFTLSSIAHGWKPFTANKANAILGRRGAFWSPEYFDRMIRDQSHYDTTIAYIAMNPVKAGLCKKPEEWRFSSAWEGRARAA